MIATLLAGLVQLLTLAANVSAMWKMRADMATNDADKKVALDNGLKLDDMAHRVQRDIDWVRSHIAELRDDTPAPAAATLTRTLAPVVVAAKNG